MKSEEASLKVSFFKKKFWVIFLGLVLVLSILGASYAYWMLGLEQKDFDTLGTKCFELTMTNASSGISLDKISPTSDEEGKKGAGYTFTIKNTCNTNAAYQVNLEELAMDVKRLSNKYIKVSLNDSLGKVLNTYEEVTATIDNADTSHKLTNGILRPDEDVTYTLKLWMDKDTPLVDEVTEASFESKVTVIGSYLDEDALKNDIDITFTSKTIDYNKESEVVEIHITATKYDIVEISYDGENFSKVATPSKNVILEKEFFDDLEYKIYAKDEVGNIKEAIIPISKIDKNGPTIEISKSDEYAPSIPVNIKISDKAGLSGYKITADDVAPTEWISISNNTYEFVEKVEENKSFYVWAKDTLGNINKELVVVSTIDKLAPKIISIKEQDDWGQTSTISVITQDTESGIVGYYFTNTKSSDTSNIRFTDVSKTIEEVTYTYEASYNSTFYFYVKDGAGNINEQSFSVTKADNKGPTFTLDNPYDDAWTSSDVTVTATVSDDGSGVSSCKYGYYDDDFRWDMSFNESNGTYFLNYQKNVYDTIYVQCYDNVGNSSESTYTTVKIDKIPPSVDIYTTYDQPHLTINIDAEDDFSDVTFCTVQLDGGQEYTADYYTGFNFTYMNVPFGEHKVEVTCYDSANNSSFDSEFLPLANSIPPKVIITEVSTVKNTVNVSVDAKSEYSSIAYCTAELGHYENSPNYQTFMSRYTVDKDVNFNKFSDVLSFELVENDYYDLVVRCTDTEGNIGEEITSVDVNYYPEEPFLMINSISVDEAASTVSVDVEAHLYSEYPDEVLSYCTVSLSGYYFMSQDVYVNNYKNISDTVTFYDVSEGNYDVRFECTTSEVVTNSVTDSVYVPSSDPCSDPYVDLDLHPECSGGDY